MPRRMALALLLAAALAPAAWRTLPPAAPPAPCQPEGRGVPPRGWLGCAADPGPARPLTDEERLLLGLPLDPNRATARDLGFVPGLGERLGEAVVAERERHGPFATVDELVRVPGIGPKRLERARPSLAIEAGIGALAPGGAPR